MAEGHSSPMADLTGSTTLMVEITVASTPMDDHSTDAIAVPVEITELTSSDEISQWVGNFNAHLFLPHSVLDAANILIFFIIILNFKTLTKMNGFQSFVDFPDSSEGTRHKLLRIQ
jgi:hypothetical protein